VAPFIFVLRFTLPTESLTTIAPRLGPLDRTLRVAIMEHARELTQEKRRIFHRLLILSQERGLTVDSVRRAAAQTREHVVPA
jgi:hypothetical protein